MADICLIVEGTYPYVSGGVSAWTHHLIQKLSSLTFSIVHIGSRKQLGVYPKYKLPKNVVSLQDVYLFDDVNELTRLGFIPDKELQPQKLQALKIILSKIHEKPVHDRYHPLGPTDTFQLRNAIRTLFPTGMKGSSLLRSLSSAGVWNEILDLYFEKGEDLSFIDFFYSWRSVHLPIFKVLSHDYPKARLYHSLCTGYAGLGALKASIQHNTPMVLTEHGIYAHERAIEIAEVEWLSTDSNPLTISDDSSIPFRQLWVAMFRNMSRLAYSGATDVTTLYAGNQKRQLSDGCQTEKMRIIANGIGKKFENLRKKRDPWNGEGKFVVGFIGRIVSIKDIRTLIKAVSIVEARYPNVVCNIIGPSSEEKEYAEECLDLVSFLGLSEKINFIDETPASEIYGNIDCLALSSISEAQPLVVLEAGIAGVPVVSTNVGCCPELLNGRTHEDKAIGASGLISPIGDSKALAENILKLILNPELWRQMSESGIKRVKRYYDETDSFRKYDTLYKSNFSKTRLI